MKNNKVNFFNVLFYSSAFILFFVLFGKNSLTTGFLFSILGTTFIWLQRRRFEKFYSLEEKIYETSASTSNEHLNKIFYQHNRTDIFLSNIFYILAIAGLFLIFRVFESTQLQLENKVLLCLLILAFSVLIFFIPRKLKFVYVLTNKGIEGNDKRLLFGNRDINVLFIDIKKVEINVKGTLKITIVDTSPLYIPRILNIDLQSQTFIKLPTDIMIRKGLLGTCQFGYLIALMSGIPFQVCINFSPE